MCELIVNLVCDEMNIRRCLKKSIAVQFICSIIKYFSIEDEIVQCTWLVFLVLHVGKKNKKNFMLHIGISCIPLGECSVCMYVLQYGQICWNVLIMRKQSCCAGQLCDGRKGGGQWAWCVS